MAIRSLLVLSTFASSLVLFSCGEEETPSLPVIRAVAPVPEKAAGEFSGQKAYDHIVKLTSFGPRPPASEGYAKSLAYLEETLKDLGWATRRSTFQALTPKGRFSFTNLLARHAPEGEPDWEQSPPYLIGGHLDSKFFPDLNFTGVNDSGSSTGVMLELARVLSTDPGAAANLELVFFDGEEAFGEKIIFERGAKEGLYGSTNFAQQLRKRQTRPTLGIVLDLVGDPKVPLLVGGDSHPNAIAQARAATKALGLEASVSFPDASILDDHIPLQVYANLPVLHLIGDFQKMPYWHTAGDTLDKITPQALENSGRLTLQVLHQMTK